MSARDGKQRLGSHLAGATVSTLALITASAVHAAPQNDERTSAADIVVTATKQESTVARVPLSIAVVTREAIDQQSLRTPEDLSRVTPSLAISNGSGANGSTVTIRGLSSNVGAPTVGIYLDDVSLTRRSANGAFAGNGTNFPQFFDLERVEILRGPQGTLYGGSSIGGTIKFILPTPSLAGTRLRAKAEVATTRDGAASYELGVSAAAPLIEGRLGLAISAFGRHVGGYIDHVSRYTGNVLASDTNSQESLSGRIALRFEPVTDVAITPAFYASYDKYDDSDNYWTNIGGYTQAPFTTPSTAAAPTITGLPYTHPGFVFPDYNVYGPGKTGANCNVGANFAATVPECVQRAARDATLSLPSLTIDVGLGGVSLKSVTSYTRDVQTGTTPSSYDDFLLYLGQYRGGTFAQDFPSYASEYRYNNTRTGWTQELRLSTGASRRLSLVGGIYYSNFLTTSDYGLYAPDFTALIRSQFGQTLQAKFAADTSPFNFLRNQRLREKELAGFGEVTFKLTEALHVLAGLRVAKQTFSYFEAQYGTTVRRNVATTGNGLTEGTVTDTAVSPKVAVQYFIDGRNMIYASATKGFRAGGVASRPAGTSCDAELASLGFGSATAVPYKSDSVWSYEIGAKVRPFGNVLTIDASAYRIDWKDAQVNYRLTCQGSYVANAGKARSQGIDLNVALQPSDWLTVSGTLAFVDATYDALAVTIGGVTTQFINQGDRQPVPRFSYALGVNVHAPLNDRWKGYARTDYQHADGYPRTFGPGTNGFFPDVYLAPATDYVSARVGIENPQFDISLFVNNLFNAQDVLTVNSNGGRGGCTITNGVPSACTRNTTYQKPTTYRPRTIGLTARFKL